MSTALARVSPVLAASIPTHMILLSNKKGVEVWRAFPRESITEISRERIEAVSIEAGYPRARLLIEVKASDGSPARLEVIPSSDRSGVLPASPAELEQIRTQIIASLAQS